MGFADQKTREAAGAPRCVIRKGQLSGVMRLRLDLKRSSQETLQAAACPPPPPPTPPPPVPAQPLCTWVIVRHHGGDDCANHMLSLFLLEATPLRLPLWARESHVANPVEVGKTGKGQSTGVRCHLSFRCIRSSDASPSDKSYLAMMWGQAPPLHFHVPTKSRRTWSFFPRGMKSPKGGETELYDMVSDGPVPGCGSKHPSQSVCP